LILFFKGEALRNNDKTLNLKKYRLQRNLSLRRFSEEVGISPNQLSYMEQGRVRSGLLLTWEKLAQYFGVSIDELRKPYSKDQNNEF
jgi:transcriptional regulator with XRE-family HTH domain